MAYLCADLQDLHPASKADFPITEPFIIIWFQLTYTTAQCPYLPVTAAAAHIKADTAVLLPFLPTEDLHLLAGRAGGFYTQAPCDLPAYIHRPAALLFFYHLRLFSVYCQHFRGLFDQLVVRPFCRFHWLPPAVIKVREIPAGIPASAVKILQKLCLISNGPAGIGLRYFISPHKGEHFFPCIPADKLRGQGKPPVSAVPDTIHKSLIIQMHS